MADQKLDSYLRKHRRESGLSQRTMAGILGLKNEGPVSRYERMQSVPSVVTALGYQNIFGIPVSELFAGVNETVRLEIEERLRKLEVELQQTSGTGPKAPGTARVLEWLGERRLKTDGTSLP
ncbi:MAG: helix-turn-helix transcriptional regulator [Candidatus Korobacteraceae bacterium]|jgi:transcriptional regulator with XRE-family HTH domain